MAKTKEFPIWQIIIIIIMAILILKGSAISQLQQLPDVDIVLEVPNVETSGECSLLLNKYIIKTGESITAKLEYEKYSKCDIFIKVNNLIWINAGETTLNSNGQISYTYPISIPGTYEILAVCDGELKSCKTNSEILTVQNGGIE